MMNDKNAGDIARALLIRFVDLQPLIALLFCEKSGARNFTAPVIVAVFSYDAPFLKKRAEVLDKYLDCVYTVYIDIYS